MNPKNAHRVMVSEALLTHLVTNARINPSAEFSSEILKRLAPILTKITDGVAKPAYTEAQKLTKLQSLGLEDTPHPVDLKQQRADAFVKWQVTPELCGAIELDMVKTYRWEHDMLSPEEEAEYYAELNEKAKMKEQEEVK